MHAKDVTSKISYTTDMMVVVDFRLNDKAVKEVDDPRGIGISIIDIKV